MADNVKWLKLMNDMFDDEKIEYIEGLPDGDKVLIIWVKILCLASKCNSNGSLMLTSEIPYTPEMLANKFKKSITDINYACGLMQSLEMLNVVDKVICVSNWCKYQNVDELSRLKEQNRLRVAKHRERKKLAQGNAECNVTDHYNVTLKCNENALSSISISSSNNKDIIESNSLTTTKNLNDDDDSNMSCLIELQRLYPQIQNDITSTAFVDEPDYAKIIERFAESEYLRTKCTSLSWIIKNRNKIESGFYTDKPNLSQQDNNPVAFLKWEQDESGAWRPKK